MKPRDILKNIIWRYQKSRLGDIGKNSNINILTDVRGVKKNIFIGSGTTLCKYVTLEVDKTDNNDSSIIIGDNTLIASFVMLRTHGGTIKIGDSCAINSFSVLHGHGNLTIGNGCLIGPQVTIMPANYGFRDRNTPIKLQTPSKQGITIEDDVWIGAGVIIVDGCTLGQGCIIGAGTVVNKNIEPYSIVGGVSAKKIAIRE